jgi:hypothetical protein
MVGPADFTMNDESGIVVEGNEREPFIRQPWHPAYYQRLCEGAGLEKAKDLLMWELHVGDKGKILPIIWDLDKRAREDFGIRIRRMTRRSLRRDLDAFAEVYNAAWSKNWGFVPYSKEDLDGYAQEMQFVFDPHWFMVAETPDGEIAGVAMSPLDLNQVLRKMHGRVFPFAWRHLINPGRSIDRVRVGFLGVKPEHQNTGVAACFYIEHFKTAGERPQTWAEMGWILEDNPINKGMAALGGEVVKRYRMYQRAIGSGG